MGYQIPALAAVTAGPWRLSFGGHSRLENPSSLPGWQYANDIAVTRNLLVGLNTFLSTGMLQKDDHVAAQIKWTASGTGLQGAGPCSALNTEDVTLNVVIPGECSGGELELESTIFLASSSSHRNLLQAYRPGSVLWSDKHSIMLEGEAFRFPTEALSFELIASARPESAWLLDARADDLDSPALASVRLLLNIDSPVYQRLQLQAGSAEAERTKQFIAYDIARQLVALALNAQDLRDEDYPRGSIGQILRARLKNYFGTEAADIEALRSRWKDSPGELESILQSNFAL